MFKFLKAARSLVNQGMSKEAIEQFAKQEFGEINELFQKQIDNLFKQKQGIENIKIKDEVFDDTVIKLPIDDMGAPFNPKDPMKQYGKPKKSKKMTDVEEAIDNASPGFAGDRKYDAQLVADDLADKRFGKEFYDLDEIDQMELYDEAYQGLSKQRFKQQQNLEKQFNKDVEEAGGMEAFLNANPISEKPTFRLNKERFKKDFNVTDEEVEKISLLSPEDQQKKVKEYIDKDLKEQIELSDYDVTDLEPNAEGGIVGYYTGGMVDVEPNLSDIGHGSDALMARTRLVAPDGQATTSTGLNYLLAEDNDNIRVPFAGGYGVKDHQAYIKQIESELHAHFKKYKKMGGTMKFNQYAPKFRKENYAEGGRIGFSKGKGVDLLRRGFLKTMGAAGAGIAALKSGILSLGGKQATKEVAKELITTPAAAGKPPWFDALVTRVIREGDDVTKTMATKDRQNVYRTKIDDETEIMVTQDLDEGVTRIDIDDSMRNVTGFDDPPTVSLQVTDEIVEEGGQRIKPEFKATENDYRNYATDPDGGYETEFVENTVDEVKNLTSDLTKVKSFATKKGPTMEEIVISKKKRDDVKYANENPSSYAADRGPDYDPSDYIDDMADDYASGGIARMLGQ